MLLKEKNKKNQIQIYLFKGETKKAIQIQKVDKFQNKEI